MFMKILQNSQEKTFTGVITWFFFKVTQAQVFPCEFSEISKNTYFVEHLRTAASKEFRKLLEVYNSFKMLMQHRKILKSERDTDEPETAAWKRLICFTYMYYFHLSARKAKESWLGD